MNKSYKIALGLMVAAALVGGGMVIVRHDWQNTAASDRARFRATTKFHINTDPFFVGQTVSSDFDWFETQIKTLTSRGTLLIVIKRLALDTKWNMVPDAAAARLERMIEVEQERGTEIVIVIAWSDEAEEAANIANGVREAYAERRGEMEEERFRRLSTLMTEQIKTQENAVEQARLEMLELQKKHNIGDLSQPSSGQPPADPKPPKSPDETAAERQIQSDYATSKFRYESQLQLLLAMREHTMKRQVDEGLAKVPVEVLEPARSVEVK